MNRLTLAFAVSIVVGLSLVVYLAVPADAVTSRLGTDLRSSAWADLAVDNASSSGIGLIVRKGRLNIGQYTSAWGTGARFVVNGFNGGDYLATPDEGYTGKYGLSTDAIYAFASGTTGAAISAEQQNASGNAIYAVNNQSTGYAIYSAGGKNYFAGNVGIGTASPSALFDVQQQGTSGQNIDIAELTNSLFGSNITNTRTSILFNQATDSGSVVAAGRITAGIENDWFVDDPLTHDSYLLFQTTQNGTNAEKMRITSAGNIGISQTAPGAKLAVNNPTTGGKVGSATDALYAYSSSSAGSAIVAEQGNASGYGIYSSGGKNYFGGKVGIGTSTPEGKLHMLNSGNETRLVLQNNTSGVAGAAIVTKNRIGPEGNRNYLTEFITGGNEDSNLGAMGIGWISDYVLEGYSSYGDYTAPSNFRGWQWIVYDGSEYKQRLNLTASGDLISRGGTILNGRVYCLNGITIQTLVLEFTCFAPRVDYHWRLSAGNVYNRQGWVISSSYDADNDSRFVCAALGGRFSSRTASTTLNTLITSVNLTNSNSPNYWQDISATHYPIETINCTFLP